ncbi:purine-binding chemotaxis protein CheW [Formivibrio citricus]|uniref:Purine-binding chemotaxis protein CheW n=1 Tax=Formivibrio citricus TaxID=83765 RepID=A0A1I4V6P8_9NEIS|nr:chemotaxis protein CheW [Formivibrio citricus]SFM96855.1 purine-binding chemotaxis protein CheW [Formivibrio citricus]
MNKSHHEPALQEAGQQDAQQYLTFLLGRETFAIGISGIREIIEFGGMTSVPLMPPFLRGVLNLRGAVVPVVDISVRFGREETPIGPQTCVVILEVAHEGEIQYVGVLVDSVNEVVEIAAEDIEPPPSFGSMLRPEFIQGMGKVNGQFVVLLSVDYVLSIDEMAQISHVAESSEPAHE